MGVPLPNMEFPVAIVPGGIGYLELLLLFGLILVVFGPKRLPELARKIGSLMEQLRKAAALFHSNILAMDDEVEDETAAVSPPLQDDDSNEENDGPLR